MEKKNWAIVDDDMIFHLITKTLIQRNNVDKEIFCFKNGKEAIDYLEDQKDDPQKLPDVILLDLYMPVMDGWEFIQDYVPLQFSLSKEIMVYIVSSSVDTEDIEQANQISAVKNYVIKPMDQHKFEDIIQEMETL